ncbi:hypothetical protein M2152_002753 [Microbacteriaceae bacterium SG_E_30_P1]|uniref:Dipeptidyl aminopeptidase n=1 Tax=Antiquaquibacter oligotrophicus TaxID=2880260 RepID=A0ABT6KRG7_9MICO|nr:dipeptidyl aminopeptidase [Antiquaquibacter oligotrophicus]MDH6182571.1 hypothetical protein [Antiquaquibacter oligotrophicus]UDF14462.1 dipeptidyl aminopeptidase [Antiquaquibacter oligotrophicus]
MKRAIRFSDNDDFDFDIRTVIGSAVERAADIGEVLAATYGIAKGDHDAWFAAWDALAARTAATAASSAEAGHTVSAAEAYLRASNYYGVAVNAVSSLKESTELVPTFEKQKAAWEGFIDQSPAAERVEIPYEGSSLPGYFFSGGGGPTLVAVNGSDGSLASVWSMVGGPALRRGFNVLLFDGPGQQSQLFEHNVPFRFDWEAVLTPVVDYLLTRDDVEEGTLAVYGISQAGYWVTRAIAFEHRFAAAVVDPGVVDVSTSWTGHLPQSLLHVLDEGDTEKFDRDMAFGMKISAETGRTWEFRARPYGTEGYADTITEVRKYNATEVASQITTPLLILSPEDEQFWPGQAEQLAELTPGVSTLLRFTAAEGGAGHCEPLARGLVAQRVFDWLAGQLKESSPA